MFLSAMITVYVLAISSLYMFQEKLLFVPEKLDSAHVFNIPGVQEVFIPVEGSTLHALHYRKEGAEGVVFFLHGNAGSLSSWLTDVSFYEDINYDLFMIDYRGYGKSTGSIERESQFMNDVDAAYRYLAPLYEGKKIIVFGRSLGTYPASCISEKYAPDLTVLVSPFYNLDELRRLYYSWAPQFVMRYSFDTSKCVKNIKNPIFVLHGEEDELIPFQQSELLVKENPHAKLIAIPRATHNDIHLYPQYIKSLKDRFKELL